jgi:hypothetical protein
MLILNTFGFFLWLSKNFKLKLNVSFPQIKSDQTDLGGEYRKLNTYFKNIDIHYQLICPYTHEDNGITEC